MSTQASSFWGEVYIDLMILARQFWNHLPPGEDEDDITARIAVSLERSAHECLEMLVEPKDMAHWQTELVHRTRQREDIPF